MKGPRPDRDDIVAWCRLNPSAGAAEVVKRWGIPRSTADRYIALAKLPVPPSPPAAKGRGRAAAPRGTPARRMSEDDREAVVATVRDAYAILRMLVERTRVAVEAGSVELNRDTTQAMLNLQRMAAGLVDAHPGLLELVKGASGEGEVTDDDLDAILKACIGT